MSPGPWHARGPNKGRKIIIFFFLFIFFIVLRKKMLHKKINIYIFFVSRKKKTYIRIVICDLNNTESRNSINRISNSVTDTHKNEVRKRKSKNEKIRFL